MCTIASKDNVAYECSFNHILIILSRIIKNLIQQRLVV